MPRVEGPTPCSPNELTEVIALVDSAMREGSDQTMLTDYPLVYQNSNLENIRVIKVDDCVVSVVPFLPRPVRIDGCRFSIGIISPTATHPKYRRKGYGLSCLRSCIDGMNNLDCELSVLWTQIATFPFYECGDYQSVRYQGWIYKLDRHDAGLFRDNKEEVTSLDPTISPHLEDLGRMHEEEVFGIDRSSAEQKALFALPKLKTLIALQGGKPTGYLILSRASNKPGLIEAGGHASSVETLLHHALSGLEPEESIEAYENLTRTVMGCLLHNKVADRRQVYEKSMMIRINQPAAFLRKLIPWMEKQNAGRVREFSLRVADASELLSFRFSEAGLELGLERLESHLEVTRRELTSWVFGPHPARPSSPPEVLLGLFPFYFPIWQLDQS